MATTAETRATPTAATSTIRRLLLLKNRLTPSDRNPLIPDPPSAKKNPFAALRGLGCASASSSQVFAPAAAAVRSSADWPGKRSRRRRVKQKKKPKDLRRPAAAATSDVWCAPGIAFAADAPVDCVVRGGRVDSDRVQRSCVVRRGGGGNQERLSAFIDVSSDHETPLFGSDVVPSGQLRHIRGYRRSPGGLEEIMMFQTRLLLGAIDAYDQYRDLRLDVDGMTYEELLELGDKIGYVSTGLREEEILCCLRKSKNPVFTSPSFRFSEMERKCCICQEEYEVNDEMGRLYCGHSYHTYCIKQWLLQKNACPVCKSVASKVQDAKKQNNTSQPSSEPHRHLVDPQAQSQMQEQMSPQTQKHMSPQTQPQTKTDVVVSFSDVTDENEVEVKRGPAKLTRITCRKKEAKERQT